MVKVVEGELKGEKRKAVRLKDGTRVFDAEKDVEELLYMSYGEMLQTGDVKGKSWLGSFVKKNLRSLEKGLGSDPMVALSAMREIGRVTEKTQDYINRKKATDTDFSRYLLRSMLLPWQVRVYDSPSKKKTMLAGRRAGKSWSITEMAISHVLGEPISVNGVTRPRHAMIMGLTLEKTASIYWENIKQAIDKCHIHPQRVDNSSYVVAMPNGNTLELYGNNSKAEREKLRGKDLSFIAVDECQSQQALHYLFSSILEPMIKGTDGEVVMAGTGPISAGGYWEEAINDDRWEHFHATMEDNIYIPDHEMALSKVLIENGWSEDNIVYRREYLGELAYDTERLVYPSRTYYTSIPKGFHPVKCYVGVDYGWRDYSSFAPILIDDHGEAYLWNEWKRNKTPASELVEEAARIQSKVHKEWGIPVEDIWFVADTSHQQVTADIYNQNRINIRNAYKQDENYQIARVQEALEVPYLYVSKGGPFDDECNHLVWEWNEEKAAVVYRIDDDQYHPDIADSVRYAWNAYLSDTNAYGG